ncbi:MAG: tetraacyldisaccharide 4'-kinase [Bacteroidales bacterium]|nr:tetraacyldisaccharide 4'-kinase [Bacteroidales bacterium]
MNFLRILLLPFALLYGILMCIRNKFFDWKIISSESFKIPTISVGNLSAGGTGKTPHIEYLIRLLFANYKIATLSRGYGRKSKGFIKADISSNYYKIGDEPLQFKQKFPEVTVAVDEKRKHGIKLLSNLDRNLDVVLLDDAFQHRYIKPGLSILLTDFHKLYTNDYMMPTGTLREFRKGAKRANIIIVTKTYSVLSPLTRRRITKLIKPKPHQTLLFSYIKYNSLQLVPGLDYNLQTKKRKFNTILMFTGIANSYPLQQHLKNFCSELIVIEFHDHHKYTQKDTEKINKTYSEIFSKNKAIVTTEKDSMRLYKTELIKNFVDLPLYFVPIEMIFHNDDKSKFEKIVLNYVKENKKIR